MYHLQAACKSLGCLFGKGVCLVGELCLELIPLLVEEEIKVQGSLLLWDLAWDSESCSASLS